MDFEIWWLLAFIFWMTVSIGVYRLALAYLNRHTPPALSAELEQRLGRIEYAVESTAVEVERIGEAQRFLTRRLTERLESNDVLKSPPPERVITPH